MRSALPGFRGVMTARQLAALALRDDVESRLVVRDGARWSLAHGPFRRADLDALPERNWTLLVQGVNLHSAAADALLRRFSFLPFARLDDVMVSLQRPAAASARTSTPTTSSCCRARAAALALRAPGGPRAAGPRSAQDPAEIRAAARRGAGSGRHAVPAAVFAHDGTASTPA